MKVEENLYNQGTLLLQREDFVDAVKFLKEATILAPTWSQAFHNLGNALLGLERNDEAVAAFDRAIELRPDFAEAHNNRGRALFELYQQDEALQAFETALKFAPNYIKAQDNRRLCKAMIEEEILKEALAQDISSDMESWSKFASLMGHSFEESPDGFAGGFMSKIPGISDLAKGTYSVIWRLGKAFYDRTSKSLMSYGIPEISADVAAALLTSKVYPLVDQVPWLARLVVDKRLTWEESFRVTGLFITVECLDQVRKKLKDGKGVSAVLKADYLKKFTSLNKKQQERLVGGVLIGADQVE